jgi:MinD-like ATPase involved in chromosome partitioning or flagellar assembly
MQCSVLTIPSSLTLDILKGKDISDTVYSIPKFTGLYLVPAPLNLGTVTPDALTDFAQTASNIYDIVIFDFPAGIDFSLYSSLPSDTLFLTVALPDPVSIRDASIVSDRLEKLGLSSRLLLNCFDFSLTKRKIHKSIDDIIDGAGLRLLGIVPRADELQLLSIKHKLKPKGKPLAAFLRIARRLSGENILLPNLKKI